MTPLDDLPAEQRAVLELVLKRGRSYDEIAGLLSIDRARVRQRALAGLDALGPETGVAPERRALITDYLLGQLPERLSDQVAQRLAREPGERAWARVIASELAPVASAPLPGIPAAGHDADEPGRQRAEQPDARASAAVAPVRSPGAGPERLGDGEDRPPGSRRGGLILLGAGALLVVIIVAVIIVLSSGGSSPAPATSSSAGAPTTPTTSATAATGTGTTGTTPKSLATVKLTAPAAGSKAQGVAEAFEQSGKIYLALVAINLAANSHNFYAVWLSNGPSDSRLIGFSPPVTSNGRLQAAGTLRTSDSRYKNLLLTLETTAHPKTPGTTVLSGALTLKTP